jgi:hypothetical protein
MPRPLRQHHHGWLGDFLVQVHRSEDRQAAHRLGGATEAALLLFVVALLLLDLFLHQINSQFV